MALLQLPEPPFQVEICVGSCSRKSERAERKQRKVETAEVNRSHTRTPEWPIWLGQAYCGTGSKSNRGALLERQENSSYGF